MKKLYSIKITWLQSYSLALTWKFLLSFYRIWNNKTDLHDSLNDIRNSFLYLVWQNTLLLFVKFQKNIKLTFKHAHTVIQYLKLYCRQRYSTILEPSRAAQGTQTWQLSSSWWLQSRQSRSCYPWQLSKVYFWLENQCRQAFRNSR